jgi:predicted RNase H-like HicB family nuclease
MPAIVAGVAPAPGYTLAVESTIKLTAVIRREGGMYTAFCPELDIASQGRSVEEARRMIAEAVELHLADCDPGDVEHLLDGEPLITIFEARVRQAEAALKP